MIIDITYTINATDNTKSTLKGVRANMEAVRKKMTKVANSIFSVKNASMLASGLEGFGALIQNSIQVNDQMAKMSDQLGISSEKMAGFEQLAGLTGVSMSTVEDSLSNMEQRLGEAANGTGTARAELEHLNLSVSELATMSPDQAYLKIAESIKALDSQSAKAAATTAIFGSQSTSMLNMIEQGSEGFKKAEENAKNYGTALTGIDAVKIKGANNALFEAGQAIKGIITRVSVELSPYIKVLADDFAKAAAGSGGFKKLVLGAIEGVIIGVAKLGDFIQGLNFAWTAVKLAFAGVAEYILKGLQNIAGPVLDLLSMIPGNAGKAFKKTRAILDGTVKEAEKRTAGIKKELDDIALSGLPSDKIKAYFEKAKEESDKYAKHVAETTKKTIIPVPGVGDKPAADVKTPANGPLAEVGDNPELQKHKEMLDQKLELAKQYHIAEAENEQVANENMQIAKEDNFQNELINAASRYTQQQLMEAGHQNKVGNIKQLGAKAVEKLLDSARKNDVKGALGAGLQLIQGAAKSSKTMFNINKAYALSKAAINLPSAVLDSFSRAGGWPWGVIPAGITLASGLAQINAIRSSTFGGGGSAPSVGGGGSAPSAGGQGPGASTGNTVSIGQNAANPLSQQQPEKTTKKLIVDFGSDDRFFPSGKAARKALEEIEEARQEMGSNTRVVYQ